MVYQLTYDNTTINISSPAVITDLLLNGLIVNSGTAVLEFLDTGSGLDVSQSGRGMGYLQGMGISAGGLISSPCLLRFVSLL